MQFRSRLDDLNDRIALLTNLGIIFPNGTRHRASKELQTVQTFLKNEIDKMAKSIICGMMKHNLFDLEFNYTYFIHDPQGYAEIMKEGIKDFSEKNDFNKTLEIPLYSTTSLQAIIGYEAIFQLPLMDNNAYRKELADKLLELCSSAEIPEHEKNRATQMINRLS